MVWKLSPGVEPSGFQTKADFVLQNAERYTAQCVGGVSFAFTNPNKSAHEIDKQHVPEQLAVYLALLTERSARQEDNELDEQFWVRDA